MFLKKSFETSTLPSSVVGTLVKSKVVKTEETDAEFEKIKKEVQFRKNTSTVKKQLKPKLKP